MRKAIRESADDLSFKPLYRYALSSALREWKFVKKSPRFLAFALLLAILGTWYCARWWYAPDAPYRGETKLSLFFNGEEAAPKEVGRLNIYIASTLVIEGQFMSPKDEKLMNIGKVKIWVIEMVFDRAIEADKMVLTASGLSSGTTVEIRDFSSRSATVILTPRVNENDPGNPANPKGILEIRTSKRASNSI